MYNDQGDSGLFMTVMKTKIVFDWSTGAISLKKKKTKPKKNKHFHEVNKKEIKK